MAGALKPGSMPRSLRYRASELILSARPVLAIWIVSQTAASRKTLVVSGVQPVRSPPMMPAIDSISSASEITTAPSGKV